MLGAVAACVPACGAHACRLVAAGLLLRMTCYVCLEDGCECVTTCPCALPVHRACFETEQHQRPHTADRCTVCRGAYATAPAGWRLLSVAHALCALLLLVDHAWLLHMLYIGKLSRALQLCASALTALAAVRYVPVEASAHIVLRRAT